MAATDAPATAGEGEVGLGLSPTVEAAVGGAVDLVLETLGELLTDEAYEAAAEGSGDA